MYTETWQQGTACEAIGRLMFVSIYIFLHVHGCRLDHKGNVKVGDFGLAEDIYARGYVREDNKTVKVPYKWMPPESLEDGLFSEHSDVVCYVMWYVILS